MYLKKDTAEKIIKEISQILSYDINIMNEKGAILASTDSSRVGMFHEGAFIIINQHLNELVIYEDEQYKGCRKGINLPIFLEDKIIGVIGITGNVSEVEKYGNILKKMTEILTLDLFSYHKKSQQEQATLFFINEWINTHSHDFNFAFKDVIKEHGLPPKSSYAVCLIKSLEQLNLEQLNDKSACVCSKLDSTNIIIMASSSVTHVRDIVSRVLKNTGITGYICVISGLSKDYTGVRHAYHQANKLLTLKTGQTGIFLYDACVFELLVNDVSAEYKEVLTTQVLSEMTLQEQHDFTEFMEIYARCNGSISKVASELYVHKNTVQYKINKILQKTKRDPRKLNDIAILMMVATWNREQQQ